GGWKGENPKRQGPKNQTEHSKKKGPKESRLAEVRPVPDRRVVRTVDPFSGGRPVELPSGDVVEPPGLIVRFEDPERRGSEPSLPQVLDRVGEQLPAHAPPVGARLEVDRVELCGAWIGVGVLARPGDRETHDGSFLVGHPHAPVRPRMLQGPLMLGQPLVHGQPIQVLVGELAAIGGLPRSNVHGRDGFRVGQDRLSDAYGHARRISNGWSASSVCGPGYPSSRRGWSKPYR